MTTAEFIDSIDLISSKLKVDLHLEFDTEPLNEEVRDHIKERILDRMYGL